MKKLLKNLFKNSLQKGFTLIELLVVIAVLGVLATIVLLAVNPGEQLARARDTSRVAAVTQLGRSLQAYYTAAGGSFTAVSDGSAGLVATDWMLPLITSNDLKVRPGNPSFGVAPTVNCATKFQESLGTNGTQGGYCYTRTAVTFADAIVYVKLESNLYNNKCTIAGEVAWAVFSTADARFGVVCKPTDPVSGTQTFTSAP